MDCRDEESRALVRPEPRCEVAIRAATMSDLPFIDALQKMHSHMVGFMHKKALESYVERGDVLIAEVRDQRSEVRDQRSEVRDQRSEVRDQRSEVRDQQDAPSSLTSDLCPLTSVGYCIARDQYMKRDDVGIIYQLNVMPLMQRNLIGAALVKATFERAAYGCKLFSCWCAQDIQANYFWESIGFVPLAFRTGSRAKQRIHIFWQRRVRGNETRRRAGETAAPLTPYWFPSQTGGGSVAEDRIVLPIPPGTHWRDAKPVLLPGLPEREPESPAMLPGGAPVRPRPEQPKLTRAQRAAINRAQSKHLRGVPVGRKAVITGTGFKYVERDDYAPEMDAPDELMEPPKPKKRRPKMRNDPKYLKAARELRDRYLEEMNNQPELMAGAGKYDVSRALESAAERIAVPEIRYLDAA